MSYYAFFNFVEEVLGCWLLWFLAINYFEHLMNIFGTFRNIFEYICEKGVYEHKFCSGWEEAEGYHTGFWHAQAKKAGFYINTWRFNSYS